MAIISLDYETYYSVEYSLSKLSTEAYIRHPQFEVIGASLAIGNGPPLWYPQPHLPAALAAIDWTTSSLLCWNTAFDGAILGWHYGIYPALYMDAMGMARACGRGYKGASLSAVAELLGIGAKGGYVTEAKGKRYADFTPAQLKDYGDYCSNDVALTREIYKRLAPEFVRSETLVQDRMLRMFIEPTLSFDSDALSVYHDDVVAQKRQALLRLAQVIGIEHQGESLPVPDNTEMLETYDILADGKIKKTLMSNAKFAALLTSLGVDPPMKISPTTGLLTYAFAKSDEDFVELQEHEDPTVAAAVTARLGTKSTIEETRSKQFIEIAQRGLWPVQYNYWAAISSRFSGGGNANPQNLKRGGKLRDAVLPPPGHWLIAPDLSQIEARMVNYVAGQVDVIETFRAYDAGTGPDVYCVFAGRIYRRVITPDDKTERTIGKVGELSCGYGASGKAYRKMLFAQAGQHITLPEAQKVVDIYRSTHQHVEALWFQADKALDALVRGVTFTLGKHGVLDGSRPDLGIGLPNGMYIKLPGLRKDMDGKGRVHYYYRHRKKEFEIYGAMLVAICIQALARLVLTEAMLRVSQRYRVVLQTHDELVVPVVIADVEDAKVWIRQQMVMPLDWAPGLPLACTVGAGPTYGGAH